MFVKQTFLANQKQMLKMHVLGRFWEPNITGCVTGVDGVLTDLRSSLYHSNSGWGTADASQCKIPACPTGVSELRTSFIYGGSVETHISLFSQTHTCHTGRSYEHLLTIDHHVDVFDIGCGHVIARFTLVTSGLRANNARDLQILAHVQSLGWQTHTQTSSASSRGSMWAYSRSQHWAQH